MKRTQHVPILVAALAALAAAPLRADLPAFRISVEEDAVYRVRFEDLAAAGLASAVDSKKIGLTHRGEPVPIWIEDRGDGRFGPGDWIELVGERLAGSHSYYDEHSRYNVYRLSLEATQPARMAVRRPVGGQSAEGARVELRREQHLEEDRLFIRLPAPAQGAETPSSREQELWFWEKLVRGHAPVVRRIDLADLDRDAPDGLDLRIELRGWSEPAKKGDASVADHQVELVLNGKPLRTIEWNGTEPYLLELTGLDVELFEPGKNRLELAVPKRQQADGNPLIDVVLLNWISTSYPRVGWLGGRQARVRVDGSVAASRLLELSSPNTTELLTYGNGWRASSGPPPSSPREKGTRLTVPLDASDVAITALQASALETPALVALDRPSRWLAPEQRVDYVMIAHRSLLEAIEPLAALHRRRGLAVAVVDVEDVYDELNGGILHPKAIHDFLAYAYHHWSPPAPRFVLLVGDASWDGRNDVAVDANYADWTARPAELENFGKNASTPYARDAALNRRQLVPTTIYETMEGHAASDNAFVTVAGDDELPDLAIGRFPVVEPAEVAEIVAKTVRYVEQAEAGPWRRRAIFITNETEEFQRRSDRVADAAAAAGFDPIKIYPESNEVASERSTERLIEAFDAGALLVQFYGHGGRYIWRTGPPDLKNNRDLLTLEDLEALKPTGRLPVVVSLTCYSAPFDHPNADSIGEKLLRIAERGAIGVIAAAWRNSPSATWGESLLAELTAPAATVGEALMRAKHEVGNSLFVHTYNLLGDPAVPVAAEPVTTEPVITAEPVITEPVVEAVTTESGR